MNVSWWLKWWQYETFNVHIMSMSSLQRGAYRLKRSRCRQRPRNLATGSKQLLGLTRFHPDRRDFLHCHDFAMTLPWLCHDFAMTLPWLCHDFAMTLPWCPTCSTHNSNSELFWLLAVAWENSANIRGSPVHTERKSRNMNSAGDKSTWTWSRRKCFRMQHHALWKHWSRETS